MATITHLTLDQYLARNDKPGSELIAGELIAKPMGTLEHMRMERRLEQLLRPFEESGLGQVVWELSFRRENEVRIPDVVFVGPMARFEDGILLDPPLLCVEILSPSQRLSELLTKCEVYHAWGVPYCWVVDPIVKQAWECHKDSASFLSACSEVLAAGDVTVVVSDLFR